MGNKPTTTPQSDPQEFAKLQSLWVNFMEISKWSVIGIAALLLVMYFIFI